MKKYCVLNLEQKILIDTISDSLQEAKDKMADKRIKKFFKKPWIFYQKLGYQAVELNLLEILSSLEHNQWASWMKYMFKQAIPNLDGSITFSVDQVNRWNRQILTPYSFLDEKEKKTDREWAKKVLSIVEPFLNQIEIPKNDK